MEIRRRGRGGMAMRLYDITRRVDGKGLAGIAVDPDRIRGAWETLEVESSQRVTSMSPPPAPAPPPRSLDPPLTTASVPFPTNHAKAP